jgi:hypothetical protein
MGFRARIRAGAPEGRRTLATTVAVLALLASLALASSASAAASRFAAGLAVPAVESPEAPAITNVVPGTGPVGGGTTVIIGGSNFTGATEVDFGSTPASFNVKSAGKIEATAPPENEGTVDVRVITPEGTSPIVRADHFSYVPPGPAVVELVPDEGLVHGGVEVKIFGAHFEGVTEVSFGGAPAAFALVSPERINATAPPGANPTVDVRVTTPEGISPITAADEFSYRSKPPQISGLSPKAGSAAGEHAVAISGDEFYGVTGVDFGEVPATGFTVNSPGSITAIAPPETAQKVVVHVETTFGPSELEYCEHRDITRCSFRDYYKYKEPTVASVTPPSGPLSGETAVTITGTGFGLGEGETGFMFGKTLATDVECSSITTCTAVTPAVKKAGLAAVIVNVASNEPEHSKKNPAAEFRYE